MPLYMDIHKNVGGLTPEAVAEAHRKDVEVQEKHGVKFIFNSDLGDTTSGCRIRGRIAPQERRIWIDRSLVSELPRLRFTIAHEIGHLALHRHRSIKNYERIDDTDDDLRME